MSDFDSNLRTPIFSFLVGPERTCMPLHSGFASALSAPLDALMNNGQMRESKERIAVLEGVEVETFSAFCQFAYTGSYDVPAKYDGKEPGHASVWKALALSLLFHARIFGFSRKYLIDDLHKYCTKRFLHAIFSFELCDTDNREVVELVEYIYANADGATGWSYGNLLTLIIGAHVVTRPGLYARMPEFQSLLEQNGSIGAHLFYLGALVPSCEDSFGQLVLRLLINVADEVQADPPPRG
ncbi:MAG: hypothetical protein M1815_006088 [Lichina confinis]|nr:MAG: hypothetical protein M1815_006088 [Lichina confinis]